MLTFCSKRHARFSVTMWPAMLNTLSHGSDVDGIEKYFAATWGSSGYLILLVLHQSKGDYKVASSPMYRDTSVSTYIATAVLKFRLLCRTVLHTLL